MNTENTLTLLKQVAAIFGLSIRDTDVSKEYTLIDDRNDEELGIGDPWTLGDICEWLKGFAHHPDGHLSVVLPVTE